MIPIRRFNLVVISHHLLETDTTAMLRPCALALAVAAASAYQLPSASLLRRAPAAAVRSAAPCAQSWSEEGGGNEGWTDEMREKYMKEVEEGTEGGGWDNDEYLAFTKANKPITSNVDLLRQAAAYTKLILDNRQRVKPEYQQYIDELRAAMSPEELQQAEMLIAADTAAKEAEAAAGPVAAAPPPVAQPMVVAPSPPPPPQDTTVVKKAGVMSGSSYASIISSAGAAPAPAPVAAPPAPVAAAPVPTPQPAAAASAPAAPPPTTTVSANAPPLPDKDPRDLRLQYKQYLQTCDRTDREPAYEILQMIHRLFVEKPPTPNEESELRDIQALEQKYNLAIHIGGGLAPPEGIKRVTPPSPPPEFTGDERDENIGPRARRLREIAEAREGSPQPAAAMPVAAAPPAAMPVASAAAAVASAVSSDDAAAALKDALARLAMSPDLTTLSGADREALLGSLVRAMEAQR